MSYTETHIGKLRKIETGSSMKLWCKTYCNAEEYHRLSRYNDNWIEQFRSHFHEKFLVTKDAIYEKFDHMQLEESDVYHVEKNDDGTYTFVMQFYNGGTYLDECLEEGLDRI